jgi:hypothetical protein
VLTGVIRLGSPRESRRCLSIQAIGSFQGLKKDEAPLIPLNTDHYAREAELRFVLARVADHAESVALYQREADERAASAASSTRFCRSRASSPEDWRASPGSPPAMTGW